jgi:hypothetical protein
MAWIVRVARAGLVVVGGLPLPPCTLYLHEECSKKIFTLDTLYLAWA